MSDKAAGLTPNDKVPGSITPDKMKAQVSPTDKMITVLIYIAVFPVCAYLRISLLLHHH